MANLVERFMDLFTGGKNAYGEWDPKRLERQEHPAKTRQGAPSIETYEAHLRGDVGLGLVPVNEQGLCRFAAIDIDVDTIDHEQLRKTIDERKIPLNVCRSKSGGAHLYLFVKEPGLPASAVQSTLKRWASLLGYPSAEIFPKQTRVGGQNVGSWINLPYFGGDATTRYCVGVDGVKGLEEFLDTVVYYDAISVAQVDETEGQGASKMPPCLAALTANGVVEGQRNAALFNFAVFYRKSQPANWETAVTTHNSQFFSPPLEYREVQGIIKSVSRIKYQYLCEQPPIQAFCNREACVKLPFGVGHMPWQERGSYDDFVVSNCRKFLSDPPKYTIEVNGRDIGLSWEELFTYRILKSRIGERLDLMCPDIKQAQWEQQLRQLLATKTDVEAPDDASMMGLIVEKFYEFLTLRERAQNKEDLLKGLPVQAEGKVLFKASDFRRYLQGYKLDKFEMADLFIALRKQGCDHARVRVNGKLVTVWAFPLTATNEQTEAFAMPDFTKDFGSDM